MRIPQGNGVNVPRQTAGQMTTAATDAASRTASTVIGFVQKYKEQKDTSEAQEAMNAAIRKKNDWKAQNLTREGKAAEGLTEDYLKFNQEVDQELTSKLSGNAKNMFRSWHQKDAESDRLGVMMYQKKQGDMVKQSAFQDGLSIVDETIRTDAKSWPKAMEHLDNTLILAKESGVIPEEQFDSKRQELVNKTRQEIGKNYYTQDKHDFMKKINDFGFGEPEIAAYQQKYKNDLAAEQREKKVMFAEEAKLIMGKVDDMEAQSKANGDTSFFKDNAQKLKPM